MTAPYIPNGGWTQPQHNQAVQTIHCRAPQHKALFERWKSEYMRMTASSSAASAAAGGQVSFTRFNNAGNLTERQNVQKLECVYTLIPDTDQAISRAVVSGIPEVFAVLDGVPIGRESSIKFLGVAASDAHYEGNLTNCLLSVMASGTTSVINTGKYPICWGDVIVWQMPELDKSGAPVNGAKEGGKDPRVNGRITPELVPLRVITKNSKMSVAEAGQVLLAVAPELTGPRAVDSISVTNRTSLLQAFRVLVIEQLATKTSGNTAATERAEIRDLLRGTFRISTTEIGDFLPTSLVFNPREIDKIVDPDSTAKFYVDLIHAITHAIDTEISGRIVGVCTSPGNPGCQITMMIMSGPANVM